MKNNEKTEQLKSETTLLFNMNKGIMTFLFGKQLTVRLIRFALFMLISNTVFSQTTWTGATDANWFTAGNWTAGVPTTGTDATIAANATSMPEIDSAGAVCNSLQIEAGASLVTAATATFTIYGNWNNAGTFNMASGVVIFGGTTTQTISGTTGFWDLTINNPVGVTLSEGTDIVVDDYLTFETGNIVTSSNQVIIGTNGDVLVNSGFVDGNETKDVVQGSGVNVFYEVGSGSNYAPIQLYFNEVFVTGSVTVSTVNFDHPDISTSALNTQTTVNRYWNIVNSEGFSFDFYNLGLTYQTSDMDAGFAPAYAGAMLYSMGTWIPYTMHSSAANYLDVTTVTQMGCVQIGDINPHPSLYSITPAEGYVTQTMNVTFTGAGFMPGVSTINTPQGMTTTNVNVVSDSILTATITIAGNATSGDRLFAVTNPPAGGGTTDYLPFTVRTAPVANFYSSSNIIRCNVTGSVDFINTSTNGTSYNWDFGSGASPATAVGNGPFTVTYATTGSKSIKLIANSPIGADSIIRINYINVTALAPTTPSSILGATSVCAYGTNNVLYSTPVVPGVTTYNWTAPANATIVSGQTTPNLTVTFGTNFTSGAITVTETSGCGTSPVKSLTVVKTPAMPGAITGPTQVCQITTATYSVAPVTGASSYTWILPAGFTGTSTTNSITVSINHPIFTNGAITVKANNICGGQSAARTLTFPTGTPTPGVITGQATNLCVYPTSYTYSIAAVPGATVYYWTIPTGCSINGTNSNILVTTSTSISVTYEPIFVSGTITVCCENGCTRSAMRSLAITRMAPTPGPISGLTSVCSLLGTGNTTTYSITPITGINTYTWASTTGATIVTGQNSTSIEVQFQAGFTTGTISVTARGDCNKSAIRTLTVKAGPGTVGIITGTTSICSQISAGTPVAYSVAAVPGATGYNWTAPAGAIITGSTNNVLTTTATNITVVYATTTSSGSLLKVQATNTCGVSNLRSITLTTCNSPTEINQATVTSTNISYSAIYPNPTGDIFNIDINTDAEKEIKMEVFDAVGNKVISQNIQVSEGLTTSTINVHSLANGLYFVKLVDESTHTEEMKKLVKK